MNIGVVFNEISKIPFRPIPHDYVIALRSFVESSVKNDEGKQDILSNISKMPKTEVIECFVKVFLLKEKTMDPFSLSCICLMISEIERKTVFPNVRLSDLTWEDYRNVSGNSSVRRYSINNSFLAVKFNTGLTVYVYSYNKTGVIGTEFMKRCAACGRGLGHCTSSYFRDHNGFTIIRQ